MKSSERENGGEKVGKHWTRYLKIIFRNESTTTNSKRIVGPPPFHRPLCTVFSIFQSSIFDSPAISSAELSVAHELSIKGIKSTLMKLDVSVEFNCQRSTIMSSVGVKYSARDLICDANCCALVEKLQYV